MTQDEPRPKLGMRMQLWSTRPLTCRIVIEGVHVFLGAIPSKEGFVVVILIPVEGLDLQAPTLRVTTHDAGHSLVYLGGGAGAVHIGQKHHLPPHVAPALCAEQLVSGWEGKGERAKGPGKDGNKRETNT